MLSFVSSIEASFQPPNIMQYATARGHSDQCSMCRATHCSGMR